MEKEQVKKEPKEMLAQARVRKPSKLKSAAQTFLGDTAENVVSHVLLSVLIPTAKDLLRDMVTEGIDRLLFGERGARGGRTTRRGYQRRDGGTIVSYGDYYSTGGRRPSTTRRSDKTLHAPGYQSRLDNVVFASRTDATEVLDFMYEFLSQYNVVSVADFFELSGLEDMSDWTDNNWGWLELSGVKIASNKDGVTIKFPEPERIK